MEIVKATNKDLVEVLFLLKECVEDLNAKGLKHWNNAYPGSETMINSIEEGNLYLLKDIGIAKGMVVLSENAPEEYTNVNWKENGSKVLYIKYLAIHPAWQSGDSAQQLLSHAEDFASKNSFTSIRTDLYSGLDLTTKFSNDLGYSQTGEFHSSFQTKPYLAFEKGV